MTPTIGCIVTYRLSAYDVQEIALLRETGPESGRFNPAVTGDEYPAVVVRAFGGSTVNLKVLLDGNDDYWATSRTEGGGEGQWSWPARVSEHAPAEPRQRARSGRASHGHPPTAVCGRCSHGGP